MEESSIFSHNQHFGRCIFKDVLMVSQFLRHTSFLSRKMFLQLRKQMVIAGCHVRTFEVWNFKTNILQEADGLTSYRMLTPLLNISLPLFWTAPLNFFSIWLYLSPLSFVPVVDQEYPLPLQNTDAITLPAYYVCLNVTWAQSDYTLTTIVFAKDVKCNVQISSPVTIESKKLSFSTS